MSLAASHEVPPTDRKGRWYDSIRRLLIQNHTASTLLEVSNPVGQFALERLAADYAARESTTSSGWTPTTYAAKPYRNQVEVGNGTMEDVLGEDLRNCMCIAVLLGYVDCLNIALKTGVDPQDCFHKYIMMAGYIPVLEFLLEGGYITINTKIEGRSLLAEALRYSKADVVAFLLARGADMNIRMDASLEDTEGSLSPVSYAAFANDLETVKVLLSHGAGVEDPEADEPPIWWAISNRNVDMARLFIEKGVGLGPTMRGTWPLCVAVRTGHAGMVRLMLDAGGMPEDASDITHLYYDVVICGNPEIHEMFGVDLDSMKS